jgi:hypothetical protein
VDLRQVIFVRRRARGRTYAEPLTRAIGLRRLVVSFMNASRPMPLNDVAALFDAIERVDFYDLHIADLHDAADGVLALRQAGDCI